MAWKTLDDMDLAGKRVLTRVDLNVPMDDGRITDTTRIDRIVPTLKRVRAAWCLRMSVHARSINLPYPPGCSSLMN